MTSTPRCPVRACPVRYRGGPDRLCAEHQADDSTVTAAGLSQHRSVWADGPGDQSDDRHDQAGGDTP